MCKLCDSFDFLAFSIKEVGRTGRLEIVIPTCREDVTEKQRFKFCPECGRRLEVQK